MLKEFVSKVKNKYISSFSKALDFKTRASRFEYWSFSLVNFFASIFLAALDMQVLVVLLFFLTFLPSLSVTVRRFHDTNRSAWYMLFYFVPFLGPLFALALTLLRSDLTINNYGLPDKDVLKHYKMPFTLNEEGKSEFDFGLESKSTNNISLEKSENS